MAKIIAIYYTMFHKNQPLRIFIIFHSNVYRYSYEFFANVLQLTNFEKEYWHWIGLSRV